MYLVARVGDAAEIRRAAYGDVRLAGRLEDNFRTAPLSCYG